MTSQSCNIQTCNDADRAVSRSGNCGAHRHSIGNVFAAEGRRVCTEPIHADLLAQRYVTFPDHDQISAACYVVLALEPTWLGEIFPFYRDCAFV